MLRIRASSGHMYVNVVMIFRDSYNFSRRAAADPRLRSRGHWDQRMFLTAFSYESGSSLKSTAEGAFLMVKSSAGRRAEGYKRPN